MLFKHAVAAMLLLLVACTARSSNEWNDTLIGFVATTPDGVVLAYRAPCPEPLLSKIPAEHRSKFAAAKWVDANGEKTGCWASYDESTAVFLWDDGAYGWLPAWKFRHLRGI